MSHVDLVFSAITPAQPVEGMRRVMAIELPAPLDLMPPILTAVERWHRKACKQDGCRVFLRGDGYHSTVFEHGVPSAPAEAVGTDG